MPQTPAERVRQRYDETVRGIDRRTDLDRAWLELRELGELMRELAEDVAGRRARLAARIVDRDSLSLSELAHRLSMSKARAAVLVRAGRGEGSTDA